MGSCLDPSILYYPRAILLSFVKPIISFCEGHRATRCSERGGAECECHRRARATATDPPRKKMRCYHPLGGWLAARNHVRNKNRLTQQ